MRKFVERDWDYMLIVLPLLFSTMIIAGEDGTVAWVSLIISALVSLPLFALKIYDEVKKRKFHVRLIVINYWHKERNPAYENPHEGLLGLHLYVPDYPVTVDSIELVDQMGNDLGASYDWERSFTFTKSDSPPIFFLHQFSLWKDETVKVRAVVTYRENTRKCYSNYVLASSVEKVDEVAWRTRGERDTSMDFLLDDPTNPPPF